MNKKEERPKVEKRKKSKIGTILVKKKILTEEGRIRRAGKNKK